MMDAISATIFSGWQVICQNSSSRTNNLITRLIYRFVQNPMVAPSTNPFQRGYLHRIGWIHWINTAGGEIGLPWWWCSWDSFVGGGKYSPYYSYCRKPTVWEFIVPARTLIGKNLLKGTTWTLSTQLIKVTSCVKGWMPLFKPESLANVIAIKRYQRTKFGEVNNHRRSLSKSWRSWASTA